MNRKRIIIICSLMLCIISVLALSGCNGEQKAVIGSWKAVSKDGADVTGGYELYYVLREDGSGELKDSANSLDMWYKVKNNVLYISYEDKAPDKLENYEVKLDYELKDSKLIIKNEESTITFEKVE